MARKAIAGKTDDQEDLNRYRDLLLGVMDVCIIKIRLSDYSIVEYNDAMCRMLGCTREEYEARYHHKMSEFFTGEYAAELDKLKKMVQDTLAAGQKRFRLDMKIPGPKGLIWVGGAASIADTDPDTGSPDALYVMYRDITDVIQSKDRDTVIRRMRRLIDFVPSGLGSLRVVKGVPAEQLRLNRYFIERVNVLANERGEVELHSFLDCVHPDDRENLSRDYYQFLKDKKPMTEVYRFQRRDGNYIWGNVRATITHVSEDIEIAYFVYINIDEQIKAEKSLQESQRFYSKVVQAAKLSTWDYDIANRTIMISKDPHTVGTRAIIGMPQIIKNVPDSIVDSIAEEDRPALLQMYSEVNAGRSASCEVWYKPENGREPRCDRITYIVTENPDGKTSKAIGFAQNITAGRKVEERYQRELGLLRNVDDNNLVAKGHYNLTRKLILEYTTKNDSFFKAKAGSSYDEVFHSFAETAYNASERQVILDGLDRMKLIDRYQQGQMQTGIIYRRILKDRLPVWISMSIHTYMMPETGDLECFTYAYDISGEKNKGDIMGLISDQAFDYIGLIFAKSDLFQFVKKSPTMGYSQVPEDQQTSYSECCNYVRSNFISSEEAAQFDNVVSVKNILTGLKKNGHLTANYYHTENHRTLCKQLDYVWLDQQQEIVLVVRTDVTAIYERDQEQIRRIEAAKLNADKANDAKSAFLSSMSHDLRTPLNGVLGFTAFALKEKDPARKQEYLEKISESGKLLADLVNDTLELSRIESGKAVLEPEVTMSDEVITSVITALRPSADLKGIHLVTEGLNGNGIPVWCDKLKVQKIVLNLLSNSIKYTHEGGMITVKFIPSAVEIPNCRQSLVIEDNGIGMSEEFMKRMYEPFSQEKRSEAVDVQGTGLGLSIVKKYVDLMGGRIDVTSELHKGTRWVVSLPIDEVKDGQERKKQVIVNYEILSGKRVLLCEDNRMNMEIAVMLLKDKGMIVDTAVNGEEGLKKFIVSGPRFYDVILMDMRMPIMDGLEATRKIRALQRIDAKSVPIIAMTADVFEESIREAKEAGMADYCTKPIDPEKMYSILAKNLNKSES